MLVSFLSGGSTVQAKPFNIMMIQLQLNECWNTTVAKLKGLEIKCLCSVLLYEHHQMI